MLAVRCNTFKIHFVDNNIVWIVLAFCREVCIPINQYHINTAPTLVKYSETTGREGGLPDTGVTLQQVSIFFHLSVPCTCKSQG